MFGFQDQEDGTILESEERSVGTSYVSTAAFGSVTYSPPTMLRSKASSSKSDILNILEHNMDRRTLFYFSKLFLDSIKSGDKYQDLKRTITINLLNFNFCLLNRFTVPFICTRIIGVTIC